MRAAVIGDAHGNLPALTAVLSEIRKRRVDAIWNLGDLVGYGPFPNEVVRQLKEAKALSIAGNFDLKVLGVDPRDPGTERTPVDQWIAQVWSHESLTADSRRLLAALPRERRLTTYGHRLLLRHGSPASISERLEPTTQPSRFAELAKAAQADVVLCSHSHMPFVHGTDGTLFVNPGGVGRSDDGDPRASYAVLELEEEAVRVVHHRVPYNVSLVVEALQRRGLPESFGRMLLEARTLDAVLRDRRGHLPGSTATHARKLENVLGLARSCRYEVGHAHQVTRLAMDLFDQLEPLHGLDETARRQLLYAGLLHDIGWVVGAKSHHKTSQRIIQSSRRLTFAPRERDLVACIARYHRGALPKKRHRPYGALPAKDQQAVARLSAMLRVADGLDRSHHNVVERLTAIVEPRRIRILCETDGPAKEEREFALRKGDLLTEVFDRALAVTCSPR